MAANIEPMDTYIFNWPKSERNWSPVIVSKVPENVIINTGTIKEINDISIYVNPFVLPFFNVAEPTKKPVPEEIKRHAIKVIIDCNISGRLFSDNNPKRIKVAVIKI